VNGVVAVSALEEIEQAFPGNVEREAPLARYTSARIGGPAEALLVVRDRQELARAARLAWDLHLPFRVLGGGSNVLVADGGCRGLLIINQARRVTFESHVDGQRVWAESGASLGSVARRAVERDLLGLEWAATIPGTIGGAVVGNAGAHEGDTARSLLVAVILQPDGEAQEWLPERLEYGYRTSWLKRHPGAAVVLSAAFGLRHGAAGEARRRMDENIDYRQRTQPGGASWGSMFKNPAGDFAGRLIESAGLKGYRVGQAQVSEQHANFFVNLGQATAAQVWELIEHVRRRVESACGVKLELEIELIGDWEAKIGQTVSRR
jgi:UDP-N-acetylmuramate dehydrogenase